MCTCKQVLWGWKYERLKTNFVYNNNSSSQFGPALTLSIWGACIQILDQHVWNTSIPGVNNKECGGGCNQVTARTACHMTASKSSDKEWGKESDFIRKASKPRRWQTSVLKKHLEKVQNSGFFYVRGMGNKRNLGAGGDWWLQISGLQQGSEGDDETSLLLVKKL